MLDNVSEFLFSDTEGTNSSSRKLETPPSILSQPTGFFENGATVGEPRSEISQLYISHSDSFLDDPTCAYTSYALHEGHKTWSGGWCVRSIIKLKIWKRMQQKCCISSLTLFFQKITTNCTVKSQTPKPVLVMQ